MGDKKRLMYMPDAVSESAEPKAARVRERCLISTVLENPGEKWPDSLKAAIDFAELFRDTSCRIVAEAIKTTSGNGTIPTLPAITEKLPAGKTELIYSFTSAEALPLSCIDDECEKFLAGAKSKAVIDTLAEAYHAAVAHPEQVESIARRTVESVEFAISHSSKGGLTLRTPDEILAMQFDNRDMILGDRLLAKGQPLVIAGQGGLGKSRLLLQFLVACRAGLPFIGFDTRGQEMTWLVLQGENSNRRLQQDLASLRAWVGEKHWPQVNAGIHLHTLETDADNFLSLDDERTQSRIREIIASIKPDGIAWDSLYNFGIGNLSSDEDMTATLHAIARLSKAGNPDRAMVVLHHALTGKAGASRATGFDRASFARNSKVLHQWTRGQINVAPGQPDSNEVLVMSCGKCSNGKEFAPFAVRLDHETMIYSLDENFDLSAWQNEVTGKRTETDLSPARVAEILTELCKAGGPPKKAQLVKALREEIGCATGSAYRAIERTERAKAIHCNKGTKTYVSK